MKGGYGAAGTQQVTSTTVNSPCQNYHKAWAPKRCRDCTLKFFFKTCKTYPGMLEPSQALAHRSSRPPREGAASFATKLCGKNRAFVLPPLNSGSPANFLGRVGLVAAGLFIARFPMAREVRTTESPALALTLRRNFSRQ